MPTGAGDVVDAFMLALVELARNLDRDLDQVIAAPVAVQTRETLSAAKADEGVRPWVDGKTVVKELYVPKKLVNFVVGD